MEIVSNIFSIMIDFFYGFTNDYGIAIVLITILMRLVFVPLNYKQREGMKKQQEINKQVEQIKEKYKNNEQKLQAETQKLLSSNRGMGLGCLLMFLQLPIMIGLAGAVRSIASAGATSILLFGGGSLLARDSTYILPILTLVVQSLPQLFPHISYFKKLELPKPNLTMMLVLLASTGFVTFSFPTGVGLYYLVSGFCGMIEQFIMNVAAVKKLEAALDGKRKQGRIAAIVQHVSEYTEPMLFFGGFQGLMLYAGANAWMVKASYMILWIALVIVLLYGTLTAGLGFAEIAICVFVLVYFMVGFLQQQKNAKILKGMRR